MIPAAAGSHQRRLPPFAVVVRTMDLRLRAIESLRDHAPAAAASTGFARNAGGVSHRGLPASIQL
jgi:hypothetical protein